MIYIDCRPGSNGSFLEFVGNVFMAGVPVNSRNVIKEPNILWEQNYNTNREFRSDTYAIHQAYLKERYAFAYESWGVDYVKNIKVIRITLEDGDLLPLLWQTLNTPSHHGCAPANLEINTFNKLNCADHMPLLHSLQNYFLDDHTISAYNSVKADHWPDINCPEDFKSVPIEIKAECKDSYGINLYGTAFTKDNADCPRYIIRDMFKQMFKDPAETDYIRIGKNFKFDESNEIRSFPFSAFYNKDTFFQHINQLAEWCEMRLTHIEDLEQLHADFLQAHPVVNLVNNCDLIVDQIITKQDCAWPNIDVIQESYILANLEKKIKKTLPFKLPNKITNTLDLAI